LAISNEVIAMSSVAIRIALRYIAAFLVAKGVLSPDITEFSSDPDLIAGVQVALGAVLGLAAEGWYYLAHRFGWAK
jgi:hypothetical protein